METTFDEVVAKYGKWTASNIEYQPGRFTMGNSKGADWPIRRANFFGMLAEQALNRAITDLRVLDLGCLEGGLSHHLARFGAEVVGLEARELNVRKCEFVADAAGLSNVSYTQGDMLALGEYDLGGFDVILASGVLYHVDAPDLLPFLTSLHDHCRGVVIFDTHVALEPLEYYDTLESRIFGRSIFEHYEAETDEAKDKKPWASFRNNFSFWPTERSLVNLLREAGFSSATKPLLPFNEWKWRDRGIWLADARPARFVCSIPLTNYPDPDPRPPTHSQFALPHHMKPGNPATTALYGGAPSQQ